MSVILNASFVKIVCFVALFKISTLSYHVQCAQHFSCTFLFIKISIRLGKDVHYLYWLTDWMSSYLVVSALHVFQEKTLSPSMKELQQSLKRLNKSIKLGSS